MDAEAHAIMAEIHKAQHEKEAKLALKEDMSVHEERIKNALKTKQEIIALKQGTTLDVDQMEHAWHMNMKEAEEHCKEEAVTHDIQKHEERMEHAAHFREELAAKRQADAERLDICISEHQKKAALRHAADPRLNKGKPS